MTKQQLKSALLSQVNGVFITRAELARAMGYKDPHIVDKYLYNLPKIAHKYLIDDVVESLLKTM